MRSIIIKTPNGERAIGPGQPCFIVAEMSGNHHLQYEKAVEIIKAAAAAGADAIKIQTYTPDTMTIDCAKPSFVVKGENQPGNWKNQVLYDLYKTAYTPWEWDKDLQQVAEGLGLVFFSTPFDPSAVDFLEPLNLPCYKIASYEATDVPLLRQVAKTGKPVIISVGFATEDEVSQAIETLRGNGCQDIIVLHCVTEYAEGPNLDAMNLATMMDIREKYGVLTGFSDNNAGVEVPVIAAAFGAVIVEKHFMIKRAEGGPDNRFSVEPNEFTEMVRRIRAMESGQVKVDLNDEMARRVIGTVHYGCQSEKERENIFFRRSLFAVKNIAAGEKFTSENTRCIRPSVGLEPKFYDTVLGKRSAAAIERGTPLRWNLILK